MSPRSLVSGRFLIPHAAFLGVPLAPSASTHAEELQFLTSWPFVASKAVATDTSSIPTITFDASGGGYIALDVSKVAKPHPLSNTAFVRTGGFVFDLDPTPTHVFVAAGKAGLVRVARSNYHVDATLPQFGDVRVVEALRVDGREYAVVGTEFGKLSLVRSLANAGPSGSLEIEAETSTAGSVSALAVTLGATDQTLTILVGTACAGVLRFDIPRSALGKRQAVAAHLLQPVGTWTPIGSHGHVPFVRALEIDDVPTPSTAQSRAFIATHAEGIHAVDFATNGALVPVVAAGWPIHPGGISYAQGLALDKHDDRLAVANGPSFEGEWNWWGECEFPWTCDGAPSVDPTNPGWRLYENVSTGNPVEVAFLPVSYGIPALLLTPPVDVTSPGSLYVFGFTAPDPTAAIPVTAWIDTELRTYADLAFADLGQDERIVWMNYAPHAYGDPSFGIVTLRLVRDPQSGITTTTLLGRLAIDTPGASVKGEPAGRMEYDPSTQRLYAA